MLEVHWNADGFESRAILRLSVVNTLLHSKFRTDAFKC
jgi:hypothetical protein